MEFPIGAFNFPGFVAVIELINSAQSYFWNPWFAKHANDASENPFSILEYSVQGEYKYGPPTNREVDSRPWNIWGQFVLGEPQVRTHKEMRLLLTQPLKNQFVLTIDCE